MLKQSFKFAHTESPDQHFLYSNILPYPLLCTNSFLYFYGAEEKDF